MKLKFLKTIGILTICALLFTSVSTYASGVGFNFSFTKKDVYQNSSSYAKEDNEPKAYVRLMKTGYTTFKPGSILSLNVRNTETGGQVTKDLKFTVFEKKSVAYKNASYAKKGLKYHLRATVDKNSPYAIMKVQGQWLP